MNTRFHDRRQAGCQLAHKLVKYANRSDVRVLALPRGGVPVGLEVAEFLDAPLDVFVVRKLGLPGHEEYAIGAVASGGIRVLHHDIIRQLGVPDAALEDLTRRAFAELHRREQVYGMDRPNHDLARRTVIVVDDGMATGSSMEAAVTALRHHVPARIVVAVPVSSPDTLEHFSRIADEAVTVLAPESFHSVGEWYEAFPQLTDSEVRSLLGEARRRSPHAAP